MNNQLKIIRRTEERDVINTFDYEEFVLVFYPRMEGWDETEEQRTDYWITAMSMNPITIHVDEIYEGEEEGMYRDEYMIRELIEEKYAYIQEEIETLKRRLFGEE